MGLSGLEGTLFCNTAVSLEIQFWMTKMEKIKEKVVEFCENIVHGSESVRGEF